MINKLKRRFALVSAISVIATVLIVFILITVFSVSSINKNNDMLAERILMGGGRFPGNDGKGEGKLEKPKPVGDMNPELPFSTRHFTVFFDESQVLLRVNTEAIASVDEDMAAGYAERALSRRSQSGWISRYRYNVFERSGEGEIAVVFIDGSMALSQLSSTLLISGSVLAFCALLVIAIILLLSKRAVKPIADSYEKQRQFITDASHELKTPLTLILANLDIAEAELGENEWLDDIRDEGKKLSILINELVSLSRLDEDQTKSRCELIDLSEILEDTAADFAPLSVGKGVSFKSEIEDGVNYSGEEALIRRLYSILLDNAFKYCDVGGDISVTLRKSKRGAVLLVENSYSGAEGVELDKLFDRFYRADSSRTGTGFGIGLSVALAIAKKHGAEITAYRKEGVIGFKVVF